MTTQKQPRTPYDEDLAHMHVSNINERRAKAIMEAHRQGYHRAVAAYASLDRR